MFESKTELARELVNGGLRNSSLGRFLLINSLYNPFVSAAEYLLWRWLRAASIIFGLLSAFAVGVILGISWISCLVCGVILVFAWFLPKWLLKFTFGRFDLEWTHNELRYAKRWLEELGGLLSLSPSELIKQKDCLSELVPKAIVWRMEKLVKTENDFEAIRLLPVLDDRVWPTLDELTRDRVKCKKEIRELLRSFYPSSVLIRDFEDFYEEAKKKSVPK